MYDTRADHKGRTRGPQQEDRDITYALFYSVLCIMEQVLFDEILILSVEENPQIYDKRRSSYKDEKMKENTWLSIAASLNTNLDNDIKYYCDFKLVEKDGNTFLEVTDSRTELQPSDLKINLENLFNGDRLLGPQTNMFLNENWQEVFKELSPAFTEAFSQIFKLIINNVASNVLYNDLFPEKLPKYSVSVASEGGGIRRADIVALDKTNSKGFILDPTVRFETSQTQPSEVNKEKQQIYEPTIPYFREKYQMEGTWEVHGLMIGARGTIPRSTVNTIKTFGIHDIIPKIITSTIKGSVAILKNHLYGIS
ncbi:hypothetical protein ANN_20789 [Periplaneta americana]|uniref:Uncharacterized protein n=1 Tax=Periplaneta americana TaxID=6978 RepID=A0ABQ8SE15_PERAM|nr:hypothetical protein ANN_20789 [Periplaneta americana]